jgi:hypothetical protein
MPTITVVCPLKDMELLAVSTILTPVAIHRQLILYNLALFDPRKSTRRRLSASEAVACVLPAPSLRGLQLDGIAFRLVALTTYGFYTLKPLQGY